MKRRWLSWVAVLLCCSMLATMVNAEDNLGETTSAPTGDTNNSVPSASTSSTSGTCGDNVTWTLDNGTLTISGTGAMDNYKQGTSPFMGFVEEVHTLVVEEGITTLGEQAFYSFVNLTELSLPSTLTTIGGYAFSSCTGLTSFTIPASVASLGDAVFVKCSNLSEILVENGNSAYTSVDGVLFSLDGTLLHTYPDAKMGEEYIIPAGTTVIGVRAFDYSPSLVQIVIPESVQEIGHRAFANCTELKEVVLPNGLTKLPASLFGGCANLTSVTIPASVTSIDDTAFNNCVNVTIYGYTRSRADFFASANNIPFSSIGEMEASPFILNIDFEDRPDGKFVSDDQSIVFFPKNFSSKVTTFDGTKCIMMDHTNVETVSGDLDSYCEILSGGGTADLWGTQDRWGFSYDLYLESIGTADAPSEWNVSILRMATPSGNMFQYSAKIIGNTLHAYQNGNAITEVPVGEWFNLAVEFDMKAKTFSLYLNGSVVLNTFPWDVKDTSAVQADLGRFGWGSDLYNAVAYVDNVKAYNIGSSGDELVLPSGTCGENLTWKIDNCTLIISGKGEIPAFSNQGDQPWYNFLSAVRKVIVGEGITGIGFASFKNCTNLTTVTLPGTLLHIRNRAFDGCSKLANIKLPSAVFSIGNYSFAGCRAMRTITIPNGVSTIGDKAFAGCNSLETLSIPASVTSIGNNLLESSTKAVVYGSAGSAAEQYCIANNIPFEASGEPEDNSSVLYVDFENRAEGEFIAADNSIRFYPKQFSADVTTFDGTKCVLFNHMYNENISGKGDCYADLLMDGLKDNWHVEDVFTLSYDVWFDTVTAVAGGNTPSQWQIGMIRVLSESGTKFQHVATIAGNRIYKYQNAQDMGIDVPIGKWVELATQYDLNARTMSLYMDGVCILQNIPWDTAASDTDVATQLRIGWMGSEANSAAYVDNIQVYNGAYVGAENGGENEPATSGTCGDNLTWALDTGKLIISGTGSMYHFKEGGAPWYALRDSIKSVVFTEGVTVVGEFAFSGCSAMTVVTFPANLTRVAQGAFKDCTSLREFALPDTVTDLGPSALSGCTNLVKVKLSAKQPAINSSTFVNCVSLTRLDVPASVQNIAGNAFQNCPKVTIYGVTGSTAHSFAQANNIPFEAVGGTTSSTSGTCGENLTWTLDDAGVLTISGTGAMNTYTNQSQTPWYGNRSSIKKVVLDGNITNIANYAFSGLNAMTEIVIPDSVISIGDRAFQDCQGLSELNLPPYLETIGGYTFFGCSNLTSVVIPANVTSIGNAAFTACQKLTEILVDNSNTAYTSVNGVLFSKDGTFLHTYPIAKTETEYVIPTGVTSVGDRAFQYSCLTNIVIPEGVQHLGIGAFFGNNGLTSVTLPSTLSSVADLMFSNCSNLTEILVDSRNTFLMSVDGVLYRKDGTILYIYPHGKQGTSFTVPDGVQTIGTYAFVSSKLSEIHLPESVTVIASYAFDGCKSLKSIELPDGVEAIYVAAFRSCTALESITIPDSVTTIKNAVFFSCPNVTIYGYTGSAAETYANENSIPFVSLSESQQPSYVLDIDFEDELEGDFIAVDNSIMFLPKQFSATVTIFDGDKCVKMDHTNAQDISGLMDLQCDVLGGGTEDIYGLKDTWVFSYDVYFESLGTADDPAKWQVGILRMLAPSGTQFQQSTTVVGNMLMTYWGTDPIMTIETGRWYNMSVEYDMVNKTMSTYVDGILVSEKLPWNVADTSATQAERVRTGWGSGMFDGVAYIDNIKAYNSTYGSDKEEDKNIIATGSCGENVTWTLDDQGELKISGSGAMGEWTQANIPWNKHLGSIKKVSFSGNITNIAAYSFSNCKNLTSIEIPAGVEVIGKYAFMGCTGLKSVTLPEGLREIQNNVFSSCSALNDILLPASLEVLGSNAFNGCSSLVAFHVHPSNAYFSTDDNGVLFNYDKTCLIVYPGGAAPTSYTVPDSVTKIEIHAFAKAQYLQYVYIPQTTTSISDVAFAAAYSLRGIYVDENNPNYASDSVGVLFNKAKTILYRYPAAADGTFYAVPDGVKTLAMASFDSCRNLQEITIPDSVTEIRAGVFENSKNLVRVTLPTNLKSLQMRTFQYCTSLKEVVLPVSLMSIGQNAFNECVSLESIVIPASVTSILDTAFARCGNLTSVTILNKDITISDSAFNKSSQALTICSYIGSAAETYAAQKGYLFAAIDDTMPVITVSEAKGTAGNTVEVTISIDNNTGITGAILQMSYHPALTLVHVEKGDAFESLTFASLAVPFLNPLVLSWDGITNDTSNGTLVTLTFAIADNMPVGDYPITVTYKSGDIYDADMENVIVAVENGQISVIDFVYGDVNGDNVINGKDLTLIRRYIIGGFDLGNFNADAADVNLDGVINGKDLTLIRRFISGGFGVVLGR